MGDTSTGHIIIYERLLVRTAAHGPEKAALHYEGIQRQQASSISKALVFRLLSKNLLHYVFHSYCVASGYLPELGVLSASPDVLSVERWRRVTTKSSKQRLPDSC
ncbi:unnamed protein product [Toxocara canis]|uniref:Uncharacterized protein n=1 Tax=Toxocara canis TaxID=6265 RepID=A0A183V379_TOXCA|nr:unnamed protein product [Toxocara canis]